MYEIWPLIKTSEITPKCREKELDCTGIFERKSVLHRNGIR